MRLIIAFLLASGYLAACNQTKTSNASTEVIPTEQVLSASVGDLPGDKAFEKVLGSYVGPFGENKITLLITRADKDSVAGRSIVGGNDRPFSGTIKEEGETFVVWAKEPGDHTNDGVFTFTIPMSSQEQLTGSWKPNNAKKPIKEYTLQRKKFEYNAAVGAYPFASQRLLKPEDVENEMKEDLEFMRNEIFARHGFCFRKKHLRQQFENEDWYVPNTVDIKGLLTDIEKKNIAMIKRYEKYAEEYGDEYGR